MKEITSEMQSKCQMLVSYYNMVKGTRFKFGNEANVNAAVDAIEAADGDLKVVKAFIKENADKFDGGFVDICNDFCVSNATKKQEPVVPAVEQNVNSSFDFLGQVVSDMLVKMKMDEFKGQVAEAMKNELRQFVLAEYGPIHRKVEVEVGGKRHELHGVVHEKFDTVLKFVQMDEPVFLTGAAGTGKNFLCKQIAETLGLDFYFSNAVTQEYKLTGFTDANGTFHESQFYKAFKNGGLFMLDEMDASIPEVLIILNAAIANRYFDFPAPIGYVQAHENFRVIAAGNTYGNGADYDYVGRSQLDAASLDRFAMVKIDYDKRIEEDCADGNLELLSFCRKFREATSKSGIRTVVSYRAITRMAKLDTCMTAEEVLETCLIKGLEIDDLNAIKDSVSGCGKYSAAFLNIINKKALN